MKKIFFLILFISNSIYGQVNKVELFFYDECSEKYLQVNYNYQTISDFKSGKNNYSNNFKGLFESNKTYYISPFLNNINNSWELIEYLFNNNNNNNNNKKDTLLISSIYSKSTSGHMYHTNYYKCGKLINGKENSYYSNGNLFCKGIFNNGKIKKMFYFDKSGKLNKILFYKIKPQKRFNNLLMAWKSKHFYYKNNILNKIIKTKSTRIGSKEKVLIKDKLVFLLF